MNQSNGLVHNREIILYTYLSLISFVTIIGIGGNGLVIYVVTKFSKMQSITNIQIVSLAVADFLHLTAIPQLLLQITGHSFIPYNVACVAYCFISQVNWFAGTLTLTAMSFDRFLAIIYPYRSQKFRSQRNAIIVVFITWILAIVLMIPTFINAKLSHLNSTKIVCIQRWTYTNAEIALLPTISYTFCFGYALPGLLIFSFYLAIVSRLRQLRQKKNHKKQSITSSNRTTVLVLMIVIVFLVCNLPYWINQWWIIIIHQKYFNKRKVVIQLINSGLRNHSAVKEYIDWTNSHKPSMNFKRIMITYFCQMSSYLNSALNPILYSFLSAQFRASFTAVVSGKCIDTNISHVEPKFNSKYISVKLKSVSTIYGQFRKNNSDIQYDKIKKDDMNVVELLETNL